MSASNQGNRQSANSQISVKHLELPDDYEPLPIEAFASVGEGRMPEALFGRWITFYGTESVLVSGIEIDDPDWMRVLLASEKSVQDATGKEAENVFLNLCQTCGFLDRNDADGGEMVFAGGKRLPFTIEKQGVPGLPSITDVQARDVAQFSLGSVQKLKLHDRKKNGFVAGWNFESIAPDDIEIAVALAEITKGVHLDSCLVYDLPRLFRLTPQRPRTAAQSFPSLNDAPAGSG